MSFKIIYEKENHLFSRKEVLVEIKKEISPKKSEIEILLGTKFSSSPEAIKVNKIFSKFGSDIFTIQARIYKSKEDKENTEPKIKPAKVVA